MRAADTTDAMLDHIKSVDELREKLRRTSEARLVDRLHWGRAKLELQQVATSLRWWAVFDLIWMVRELLEPARFAWGYPSSWAYKLAAMSAHPWVLVAWFALSAFLVTPLIFALATVPNTRLCRKSESLASFGLFMGAVGFAFLSTAAARLDIPHVVDSYRGSTVMLLGTGLLVACWHNGRVVRAHKEAQEAPEEELRCGDSAA